jgi:hypothetical protein
MRQAKPIEDRLWPKTDKQTTAPFHWLFTGHRTKNGYGQLNLGPRGEGIDYVHRISWKILKGEIPLGLNVIHNCKFKNCINPEHLFLDSSRKAGIITDVKIRLMAKRLVDEYGCWIFQGYKNKLGYGKIGLGKRSSGVDYTHIVSYQIFSGEIPKGLYVLHTCDNPPCFNPEHLVLGTQQDNIDDAVSKGRMWYQN